MPVKESQQNYGGLLNTFGRFSHEQTKFLHDTLVALRSGRERQVPRRGTTLHNERKLGQNRHRSRYEGALPIHRCAMDGQPGVRTRACAWSAVAGTTGTR